MINLLPPDIKESREYGRRNSVLLGYAVAIVVIGILAIGVNIFNMQFVKSDESRLRSEMQDRIAETEKLEVGQKSIDATAAQLKTIDKLSSGVVKFSELIPKIGGLLPDGMVLNGLSLTGGKTSPLQLDVDMTRPELAAIVQQNLINSDLFEAADIGTITSKGTSAIKPGVKSYPFGATISVSFKGTAAAKKAAAAAAATPAPAAPSGVAK